MNFKKILVFLDRWGLPALASGLLAAFLAAVGESMSGGDGFSPSSIGQAVMATVNSESDSAVGWQKPMHFLFRIFLGWAGIRVYMATAGVKWDTFVARWLARRHVVVLASAAGQGQDGRASRQGASPPGDGKALLAIEIALGLARGNSVVLALPSIDDGNRLRLWDAGVTVVTEALAIPDLLRSTGTERARVLVAMRDDHRENIAIARRALSDPNGNPALECKLMVDPVDRMRAFKPEEYFEPEMLTRLRVFNETEMTARRILREFPPDAPVAMTDRGVHVLLVGMGSVGQEIALQLARVGHYRSGKRPKVTVVDRRASERWAALRQSVPALSEWMQVEPVDIRIEDIGPGLLEEWARNEWPITVVYVCTKDEIANLRIATLLMRDQDARIAAGGGAPAPIVALDTPGGCVLADLAGSQEARDRFHLFSLASAMRSSDGSDRSFLASLDDTLARGLHEGYCALDDKRVETKGGAPQANNLPWEKLPESVRMENRVTIDHFEVKLRAVGCRLARDDEGEPADLSVEEMELLARMEHDRWWAVKAMAGFRYASKEEIEAAKGTREHEKLRWQMVPFDRLDQTEKEKDIQQVRDTIAQARASGMVVVRDGQRREG